MRTALRIAGLGALAAAICIAALALLGAPPVVMNALLRSQIPGERAAITVYGATRVALFPFRLTASGVDLTTKGDRPLRLAIETAEIALPFSALLHRDSSAAMVTLTRPTLFADVARDRVRTSSSNGPSEPDWSVPFSRLIVRDATLVLNDVAVRREQRIAGIAADMRIAPDRRVVLAGSARLGEAPATFTLNTELPLHPERQAAPFDLTLDAPGLVAAPISATGDARLIGAMVSLSNLSGRVGDDGFKGWLSADLAGKPLIKLDLDFPRLSIDLPQRRNPPPAATESGWSTRPFNLDGLNYADLQGRLSIGELSVGNLRATAAEIGATLADGAIKLQAPRLAISSGTINAEIVVDASGVPPDLSLRLDARDLRARPFLSSLAGLDRIDGVMTLQAALRGAGATPRAVAAATSGTASVSVRDGEIVGINLAQMIRSLTASMLSGWQEGEAETTDFTALSASLRLENGRGSTSDLMLSGPLLRMTGAGNVDIVTQTIAFRVEPRLVMSLQGQGVAANSANAQPVGLGVPVVVQGPWASPRIYPEIAGILDNPEAAYSQLRQMGQGLFGRDLLGKDLQDLIGGIGDQRAARSANPADPDGAAQGLGKLIQGLTAPPQNTQDADKRNGPAAPIDDIMRRLFNR
jgi:AsmA protein